MDTIDQTVSILLGSNVRRLTCGDLVN